MSDWLNQSFHTFRTRNGVVQLRFANVDGNSWARQVSERTALEISARQKERARLIRMYLGKQFD